MKLSKKDFDFYYLIICSRGPGSETITVNKISDRVSIEWAEDAHEQLKKYGVTDVMTDFNDEGPILAVPKGSMPLSSIYQWLKWDVTRWDDHMADLTNQLGDKGDSVLQMLADAHDAAYDAYLSACLRVFTSDIKGSDNPWTSCNGWRKVDIEIPNKEQFEKLMLATGQTAELLGRWDCKVLQKAAQLYKKNKLPIRPFPGC